MAVTAKHATEPVQELSREEWWMFFDAQAQKLLNMSGDEFLCRLRAGEYDAFVDDPADHPEIVYLGGLSTSVVDR